MAAAQIASDTSENKKIQNGVIANVTAKCPILRMTVTKTLQATNQIVPDYAQRGKSGEKQSIFLQTMRAIGTNYLAIGQYQLRVKFLTNDIRKLNVMADKQDIY